MKVTKEILWESRNAIAALAELKIEDEKLSYKLGRIADAVNSTIKPLNRSHEKLVRKHGQELVIEGKSLDRWYVPFGTEADEQFQAAWQAVLDDDAEIQIGPEVDYKRITLEQLKPVIKQISAGDLGLLSKWLIEPLSDE